MTFVHPVPKAALEPGLGPDGEGRQHTRNEAAQEQSAQKRKSDDDDNSAERDVQAKRSKSTEQGLDSLNISANNLLDVASSLTLRDICINVLRDEIAGPRLREEFLSRTQDILACCRAETMKERNAIINAAEEAINEFRWTTIIENKRECQIDDWPRTLLPFLYRIKTLHEREPLCRGSEMAWEALIKVASLCIHDWCDSDLRISGFGEEDCDEFHEQVDELMLVICKMQKEKENFSWLRNGRMEEIQLLQRKAGKFGGDGQLTYRYKSTLLFLEQV
ncbi:hypothetical protein F4680DRAFT_469125 [Xylaria scruposa]|nr:hypothetical protein F4680DRAFT_469125 [Xylaria scruposa]